MKKVLCLALLLVVSSGCATAIPYSHREECALKGMKLTGVTSGYSRGIATAWNWQNTVTATSSAYEESVSCEMPKTKIEKCEIARLQRIATPKIEYNSSIDSKKFITGAGYVLYVIPGVVAKVVYDGKRSDAIDQSRAIASETESMCPESFNE